MARLGSWIEPFPEGIYIAPADAWIDPSQPKAARAGHPRPWRPCPRRPSGGAGRRRRRWRSWNAATGRSRASAVAYGEIVRLGERRGELRPRRPRPRLGPDRARACEASGSSSRAITSAAPTRPARRSSRSPATSSSPRRPSACPSSATPTPAREIDRLLAARSTTIPSAASSSAPMRSARRSG